jgi:hypothetical protein
MRAARIELGGLIIVMCIWAVNLELGQIMPHIDCARQTSWTLVVVSAAMLASAIASAISIRTAWSAHAAGKGSAPMAVALASVPFLFAIAMQGAASMLVNACQS